MIKSKRQQVHERIARVLESGFAETVRSHPELLAHHYSSAGQAREAVALLAGGRPAVADDRSSHAEAVGHFTRGLQQVLSLPESPERDAAELEFQANLSVSLVASRGYAAIELEAVHARARALAEGIGDSVTLFRIIWGMWALRLLRDEMDTAIDLARQLLVLAESRQDPGQTLEAWFSVAITRFYRGEFQACLEACDQCARREDPELCRSNALNISQDTGATYRCYRALSAWYMGRPDDAWRQINEAVEYARGADHPFSLAYVLHHAGWVSYLSQRGEDGIRFGDECLTLSAEQGFPFWKALGMMSRGTGHMVAGRLDESLRVVEEALAAYLRTGSRKSLAEYHGFLAEIHWKAGRLDDATREVVEALEIADRTEQPMPGGRTPPDQGGDPAGQGFDLRGGGRGVLREGTGGRPPPVGRLLGASSGHEPRQAEGPARQETGGENAPLRGLWEIHPGIGDPGPPPGPLVAGQLVGLLIGREFHIPASSLAASQDRSRPAGTRSQPPMIALKSRWSFA